MKRPLLFFCFFILSILSGITYASNLNKLDAALRFKLKQADQNPQLKKDLSDKNIRIFIQGDDLTSLVSAQNGKTGFFYSDWTTANIPFHSVYNLMNEDKIRRIKLASKIYFRNDHVIERTRARWVHEAQNPLSTSYTGKDVIIGIIDSGIDIDHPDFQHEDGSTRILYIWDQNVEPANNPPDGEGYNYGQEWTQSQINNGFCTHEDIDGHGTHVSGTAAGNGLAINNYKGNAPDADLIVVAISPYSSSFVDAASYIYQKADALGKPCVINASLGWHSTYHDGTDIDAQMIDALVEGKKGRLFCAAAGNEGSDHIHLTPQATSDEKWTYYFAGPDGYIQLQIRVPNAYLETLSFAVGVDQSDINPEFEEGGSLEYKGKTSWVTAKEIVDDADQGIYKNLIFDSNIGGRVSFEAEAVSENVTGLRIFIEEEFLNWDEETGDVSDLELWRLYIRNGSPNVDVWVADIGYPFWDFPNTAEYLEPDNQKSVGMPAVTRKVIAVGASVNRDEFINKYGDLLGNSSTPGALADFSSQGPTADHRIKPEIVAPGENVISVMSQAAYDAGNVSDEEIVEGEKHFIAGGTSMSSPAVAGCIALYLEKYPDADFDQVMAALQNSTRQDGFTGTNLPDNMWGFGKIDIHSMMQSTDVSMIDNENIIFSLSDNFPNPFNPSTRFNYTLPFTQSVRLVIYNIQGQEVSVLLDDIQKAGSHQMTINGSDWANGIYICQLKAQSGLLTEKMVLMK